MIVFLVVVYNIPSSESSTLLTLRRSLSEISSFQWRILVIDNSDKEGLAEEVHDGYVYQSSGGNKGLAEAYNLGLQKCEVWGCEYMVTLDHDSIVTPAYVAAIGEAVGDGGSACHVAFPKVVSRGRVISPFTYNFLGWPSYYDPCGTLNAINSFTMYDVSYLRSIGGFDKHYWLDALDLATFAKLHKSRAVVRLLDVTVEHNLSLVAGTVSNLRAVNISRFEAMYLTEWCSLAYIVAGLLRLFARGAKLSRGQQKGFRGRLFIAVLSGAVHGLKRRVGRTSNHWRRM